MPVNFDNVRTFYPGPYRHDTALAILSLTRRRSLSFLPSSSPLIQLPYPHEQGPSIDGANEIRVPKEDKDLKHSAQRGCVRQGLEGGGIEGYQRQLE